MKNLKSLVKRVSLFCLFILCVSACKKSSEKELKAAVEDANSDYVQNPEQIADGMLLDGVTMNDKAVVYHVTVDEDYFDMEAIEAGKDAITDLMTEVLREGMADDEDMKSFAEAVANTNRGVTYDLEGDVTPGSVPIEITPEALKSIVK